MNEYYLLLANGGIEFAVAPTAWLAKAAWNLIPARVESKHCQVAILKHEFPNWQYQNGQWIHLPQN